MSAARARKPRQPEAPADEFRLLLATTRPAVHDFFAGLSRQARSFVVVQTDVSVTALDQHEEEVGRATTAAVDVGVDPTAGVELCHELQRRRPDLPVTAILCCSQAVTPWTMRALIGAGISSVVDLQASSEEALRALRSVARGGAVLHLQSIAGHGGLRNVLAGSDRKSRTQMELLELVACGLPDHEIGRRLHLSPHTVKHHIENLRGEIGVRNRIELAAWAGRNGFYRSGGSQLSRVGA